MKKVFLAAALVVAALPGCGQRDEAHAEATLRQAREMKYSWTTTAPLLKAASEAAESGDYEKGMSLVTEALLQAELAIGQATEQGTSWKQAVVQ